MNRLCFRLLPRWKASRRLTQETVDVLLALHFGSIWQLSLFIICIVFWSVCIFVAWKGESWKNCELFYFVHFLTKSLFWPIDNSIYMMRNRNWCPWKTKQTSGEGCYWKRKRTRRGVSGSFAVSPSPSFSFLSLPSPPKWTFFLLECPLPGAAWVLYCTAITYKACVTMNSRKSRIDEETHMHTERFQEWHGM